MVAATHSCPYPEIAGNNCYARDFLVSCCQPEDFDLEGEIRCDDGSICNETLTDPNSLICVRAADDGEDGFIGGSGDFTPLPRILNREECSPLGACVTTPPVLVRTCYDYFPDFEKDEECVGDGSIIN